MINDINPLNLGFSDFFKFADETLNGTNSSNNSKSGTTKYCDEPIPFVEEY